VAALPDTFRPARNLRWSRHVSTRPIPKPSSTWSKVGLAYERRVVSSLAEAGIRLLHNPGFEFEDDSGSNYCVPDIILPNYDNKLIIIEVKLTYKVEAILKLRNLYAPVVSLALSRPVVCLVIAKNVTPNSPEPELTLESAICQSARSEIAAAGRPGVGFLVQWLGRGMFPIR
jgi:hypothetical protein